MDNPGKHEFSASQIPCLSNSLLPKFPASHLFGRVATGRGPKVFRALVEFRIAMKRRCTDSFAGASEVLSN